MKKFILLALCVLSFMTISCTNNYSQGERIGVITKFSEKGLLWKSYEGDIKIAPNIASQGMVGQYEDFNFSIDNDNTIKCTTPTDSILLYAKLGIPVIVSYQQVKGLNILQNRGDTQYFVKSICRAKL